MKMVGELFHKFGRESSERIVRQHYDTYQQNVTTTLKESPGPTLSTRTRARGTSRVWLARYKRRHKYQLEAGSTKIMSDWQHDWSEADDKTLAKMWRAKLPLVEIAKYFDVSIKEIEDRIEALRFIDLL